MACTSNAIQGCCCKSRFEDVFSQLIHHIAVLISCPALHEALSLAARFSSMCDTCPLNSVLRLLLGPTAHFEVRKAHAISPHALLYSSSRSQLLVLFATFSALLRYFNSPVSRILSTAILTGNLPPFHPLCRPVSFSLFIFVHRLFTHYGYIRKETTNRQRAIRAAASKRTSGPVHGRGDPQLRAQNNEFRSTYPESRR